MYSQPQSVRKMRITVLFPLTFGLILLYPVEEYNKIDPDFLSNFCTALRLQRGPPRSLSRPTFDLRHTEAALQPIGHAH